MKVSELISNGEFESLKPVVSENTLNTIKQKIPLLSIEHRKRIAFKEGDINGIVPYLFQKVNNNANSRVFVKIGMLYFVVPGFSDTIEKVIKTGNPLGVREIEHHLIVADYRFNFLTSIKFFNAKNVSLRNWLTSPRFVREYKQSEASSWFVSECNHWNDFEKTGFLPGEYWGGESNEIYKVVR